MTKRHQPQDYASGHGGVALMDPPAKTAKEELPYEVEEQPEAAKAEALPAEEPAAQLPTEAEAEEQARKLEAVKEIEVFRREMLVNICAKETEVDLAKYDWELKKERAADAKKVFDGLVEQLLELIRKVKNPPSMPLVDGVPEPQFTMAWRSVPLSEALVGLPESIIVSLNESNLQTMGELADWTAAYGGRNKLTDLAGIGPAKAEKIEQALVDFWSRQKAVDDGSTQHGSDDPEAASGPDGDADSEGGEPD